MDTGTGPVSRSPHLQGEQQRAGVLPVAFAMPLGRPAWTRRSGSAAGPRFPKRCARDGLD